MEVLHFIKEPSGRWYIDLPQWQGSKDDLEMVCGADTLLDLLADGKKEATLETSLEDFEGAGKLIFKSLDIESGNGAYYSFDTDDTISPSHIDMWLCDVTKFVFGYFPNIVFFKVSETQKSTTNTEV